VLKLILLNWENEQTDFELPANLLDTLAQINQAIVAIEQLVSGEVGLLFVNNETIRQLNSEYRGIDRATDVLSFAIQEEHEDELVITYEEEELPNLYGDIVISVERAKEQAEEYGHSFERELCFLYVHGFLHLIGYDHLEEQEEQQMIAKQNLILEKVGINR
jgi:probable rRNA maturation factor